jgi:hypothetical protein
MNYNTAAYLAYPVIMIFIIVYVGRLFHQNGRIFILSLFEHDVALKSGDLVSTLGLCYFLTCIYFSAVKKYQNKNILKIWQVRT